MEEPTPQSISNPQTPISNPSPIPEQSDGPLVSVSLPLFLRKFSSTIHDFFTASKPFGDYIRTIVDPQEIYSHVDYPKATPNIALIYSIISWRSAIARQAYLKEASELSREERFAIEEKAKELVKKFKERDSMIYLHTNIIRKKAPDILYKRLGGSEKKLRELVVYFLNGQGNSQVREKLDIDEDAISIFTTLPTPSHEENMILDLVASFKKSQEETALISKKDSIIIPNS